MYSLKSRLPWFPAVAGFLTLAACAGMSGPPAIPGGLQLAIADGNNLRVVDPASGALLFDVTAFQEIKRLAYRPDGTRLAVGHCFQNRVAELETATYTQLAEPITAASCPWQVSYNPSGVDLAALRPFRANPSDALSGRLTVVGDPASGGSPVDLNLGRPLSALAYRPGGAELAVATPQGLKVLSASGGYPVLHDLSNVAAARLAYTTDGARLLVGTGQGLGVLSAAAGYQPLAPATTDPVTALAVDPSGHWLAVASPNAISIRRALDLVEIAAYATGGVRDLDFSRDGTTLAAAEAAGGVRLFRGPDWTEGTPLAASDKVSEIAFRPSGFPRVPVLFVHGHSVPPADVWFEDADGTAFGKVLALNPALNVDAFHITLPLHGGNPPQNTGRSIAEDAADILAAIEGGTDNQGAVQVGILEMPDYQAAGRTGIVAYSQGTLSTRAYIKNLMGSRSNGAVTVNEYVTLAAANHGVGSPGACGLVQQPDRARRQLCAGHTASFANSTDPCGSCSPQPPPFSNNQPGDETFISDLNGHATGGTTSCNAAFQAPGMAPASRPTTDPAGILYVNLYAAEGFFPLQRDLLVGGPPAGADCLGRRVAHNFAPDALNLPVADIPLDVHANLPHHDEVICIALRTLVDHQAPANPSQACQGLTLP